MTGLTPIAVCRSDGPGATRDLGTRLAECLRPGDLLLIEGELGAGKTRFVQGLASGLGVEGTVSSPTFTLVRVLECGGGRAVRRLLHADLYRLENLKDVAELGLLELVDDEAVAAVEWGSAGAPVLGSDVLQVSIERSSGVRDEDGPDGDGSDERVVTVSGTGSWMSRADEVASCIDGTRPARSA